MSNILAIADAAAALPEIFLAVAAMALLMLGVASDKNRTELVNTLSLGALAVTAALVIFTSDGGVARAFHDSFIVDGFARFMKMLVLFGSAVAIILSSNFLKVERLDKFEYPVLVLLATVGMLTMISANDLIALYMGLELQSLSLYVIAAFNRDSARSSEAGLKYFVLGALSSGMLLYGASLIYGFTGSVAYADIAAAATTGEVGLGLLFGLVFLVAGLAFKISAVPFHMWTPDVYEGSPTPVTAFFAAAPKVAAMAVFVRAMHDGFGGAVAEWQQIIVFISIASMVLGAFAAIGQDNIKRLLAYSSIGHMGYALVGLAAGTQSGVRGVAIYMAIYMVMTLGAFACVIYMRRRGTAVERISDLAGLARNDPMMAFVLAMLMFSLAGIPPLAGFFGKYFVFLAAIEANMYTLAVIGVLASVVSAFYYLRIVKVMYFDEPVDEFDAAPFEIRVIAIAAGLLAIGMVLVLEQLNIAANAAAASLFL
ncbi:MAG: NADH-quinone oxidoreductase subunit NuoN [Anderseniella sp.]|jgi:NADH-quinone oxidoreductase subunit N|nr:NADH-quinone oxidoreductase subunit NuoN [Anderseniella sp.]